MPCQYCGVCPYPDSIGLWDLNCGAFLTDGLVIESLYVNLSHRYSWAARGVVDFTCSDWNEAE